MKNVLQLHEKLVAAGLPIVGVDSDGNIAGEFPDLSATGPRSAPANVAPFPFFAV